MSDKFVWSKGSIDFFMPQLTKAQKLQIVANVRKQLANDYLDLKFGPQWRAATQQNPQYVRKLRKALKRRYAGIISKLGPVDEWLLRARDLQDTVFAKAAYVPTTNAQIQAQLLAMLQNQLQIENADFGQSEADDVEDAVDDSSNHALLLAALALGMSFAMGLGSQDFQQQNPDLYNQITQSLDQTQQTTLDSYAALLTNATDSNTTINPDDIDSMVNDLIDKQAAVVADDTFNSIVGGQMLDTMKAQGYDLKRWIDSGDESVCGDCLDNSRDGWISVDDVFSTGDDAPGAHPNCRCQLTYKNSPESSDDSGE